MMILHSSCQLGADIMMALDDVVSSVNPSRERFEEATYRTTRWFDRCLSAHERPGDQNPSGTSWTGARPRCLKTSQGT